MNILLVEDTSGDVLLVKKALADFDNKQGNITVANRLAQALEQLVSQNFDVVILDLNLPDSHGIDTLKALVAKASSLPVIVLTGINEDSIGAGAIHQGAQDYLTKNKMNREMLQRVIHYSIERKKMEQEKIMNTKEALLSAEVSSAMTTSNTLQSILQLCVESIVRNLDTAFARIWIVNWDENMLELQASAGMYTHIDGDRARIPVGKLKIGLIVKDRKPFLTNKVLDDIPGIDRDWAKREGLVAFAGYPLIVENQAIGVIGTFSQQPLLKTTLKKLDSVATGIAVGIRRKRAEETLRKTNQKLQGSLAKIKALSGLLPICANCKDIRNDKGYYEQIEKYIIDHSDVQFSHGICPKCAKKLYPEFIDENEDTGKQQSND